MNERDNACYTIKNKISQCDELSEIEIVHVQNCVSCTDAVEKVMGSISAMAAQKIRNLQKIDTSPEILNVTHKKINIYRFSAALAIILLTLLFLTRGPEEMAGNNKTAMYEAFEEININEELKASFDRQIKNLEDLDSFETYYNIIKSSDNISLLETTYDYSFSESNSYAVSEVFQTPEYENDLLFGDAFKTNGNVNIEYEPPVENYY